MVNPRDNVESLLRIFRIEDIIWSVSHRLMSGNLSTVI